MRVVNYLVLHLAAQCHSRKSMDARCCHKLPPVLIFHRPNYLPRSSLLNLTMKVVIYCSIKFAVFYANICLAERR